MPASAVHIRLLEGVVMGVILFVLTGTLAIQLRTKRPVGGTHSR